MADQNSTLNRAFIEQQRKRLETLREELLGPEQRWLATERTLQQDRGAEAKEFEDVAQSMAENEIHQALHDVDERRLNAVDRALEKIKEGTYGLSDMSGEPIPKARLESTPEAVLTVQEEEQAERTNLARSPSFDR
jgi:DnaK suppressor protein